MHKVYPFSVSEQGDYSFLTEQGILYAVSFTLMDSLFENNQTLSDLLYSIELFPVFEHATKERNDPKTGATVVAIIKHFIYSNSKQIIVYICDSKDGKQELRKRKFNSWFNKHSDSNFNKLKTVISTQKTTVELSFIFLQNNKLKEQLKLAIEQKKASMNNK